MNKSDLTPVTVQEECAEVIQGISKVFRFGLDQTHPDTGISNRVSLATEVGQLCLVLHKLVEEWDLDKETIFSAITEKALAMQHWEKYFPEDDHNKLADPEWLAKTGLLDA
jgi:hypothetical protein